MNKILYIYLIEDSTENQKKQFSRRDFLKSLVIPVAVGGPVGFFLGHKLSEGLGKAENTVQNALDLIKSTDKEASRIILEDIINYRKKLGLDGLPIGFVDRCKQPDWQTENNKFQNLVPETIQSYGMRLEEINKSIFGDNNTRLVKGVEVDMMSPFAIAFNSGKRMCLVTPSIYTIPMDTENVYGNLNFTDYALHEAIGHGSDPLLNVNYPNDILLKVEHGKWRALSRTFSIENQFFNHPEDMMLPKLERNFGEFFAYKFVNSQLELNVQDEFMADIMDIFDLISQKGEKPLQKMKFNKLACSQLGHLIFSELRRGAIKIQGEAKEAIEYSMEHVLVEIYAEMIKYSILYPNEISNDRSVIAGCQEVINAISDREINLSDLKSQLQNINPEILKRSHEEQDLREQLTQTEKDKEYKSISQGEVEEASQQESEFEIRELIFKEFMTEGQLPELSDTPKNKKEVISLYAKTCSNVFNKHPTVQNKDDSFDPQMHIWEIKAVEEAIDQTFIRNILFGSDSNEEHLKEIVNKTETLRRFISNPAF